ncbi:Trm112 family protein [archaeon]|nr:MAG: Trm112 family protein [archaeon]
MPRARTRALPCPRSCTFTRTRAYLALQLHIMEGALVCPNCERAYPIHKGIPNMVLAEDEL